jgi:predicted acylesterase/phospholipase RssA
MMQTLGGIPHEKTDPVIAKTIGQTLEANLNDADQAMLHVQDQDTTWFGVAKDAHDDIVFQDCGRYANIMAERSSRQRISSYPALASFVGQTGAGKSTLIKLLIELHCPEMKKPQVPVVGSINHPDTPTSGDVHLYSDPKSLKDQDPILYADCEGLDGGEREPMGAKSRNRKRREGSESGSRKRTTSFTRYIRRSHDTSEREVIWAKTEVTRSRDYHVRTLYPRLLYTFSDVIVFVMKNPRVIENVVEQLIEWAEAALQKSSNQPVLPHAIIVLNACENATDPDLWDVNASTATLLESVRQAIYQNHNLRRYASFWELLKRPIDSVEDLLLSYYSSVRVVRVPERGRPKLINEQLQRLYHEIGEAAAKSRDKKHQVRMLLNSDELQPYLQYAFDHFCRDVDAPFDFVQASLANNPIPSTFGGNILKLAINIYEVWGDALSGALIFKELSFLVASCIMLESARHRTLGAADQVFPEYLEHCDDALDDFCNRHWPCEYVGPRGRCVNVKAGHTKGHQSKNGQILQSGEYISEFSPDSYRDEFRNDIYFNLVKLLEKLRDATQESKHLELQEAANIHRHLVLHNFFDHLYGAQSFISHTACYSCLIWTPQHPLPCGHVLCTKCVKAYGTLVGRTTIEMKYCPLHHARTEEYFVNPWPISLAPAESGTRILTLDGGGVRGIVELTILQQLERALGEGLPVQAFFDLIVGTSTGGIISLGLGSMGWSVDECLRHFFTLCTKAFTKRRGVGFPGLDFLVSASSHSRYQTQPLELALRSAFGRDDLFGGIKAPGHRRHRDRTTKVAVTTTTTNGTVFLLANYNRADDGDCSSYQFYRAEKPQRELKTWEAARATSAAPRIFKPFDHEPSGQAFMDGAIYYNNPIELAMHERKLIWPEKVGSHPDVVLSIGTSFNKDLPRRNVMGNPKSRWGVVSHFKQLIKIAVDHVLGSLNCEQTWQTFMQRDQISPRIKERYVRLNLPLAGKQEPPKLDDKDAMLELRDLAVEEFTMRRKDEIKSVADSLIASTFYFERTSDALDEHGLHPLIITGNIVCRFSPGSPELSALGKAFRRRSMEAHDSSSNPHNPYFVITERSREKEARQIVLDENVISRMIHDARFQIDPLSIKLSSMLAETQISVCFGDRPRVPTFYPISGFPRCFLDEDNKYASTPRPALGATRRPSTSRATWFLPATCVGNDPLENYESREYRYPGNAAGNEITEISRRFSPSKSVRVNGTTLWMPDQVSTPTVVQEMADNQRHDHGVGHWEKGGSDSPMDYLPYSAGGYETYTPCFDTELPELPG